jgi:hypothetical protein
MRLLSFFSTVPLKKSFGKNENCSLNSLLCRLSPNIYETAQMRLNEIGLSDGAVPVKNSSLLALLLVLIKLAIVESVELLGILAGLEV